MYQEKYQGKHHLVATSRMQFCLDDSPKKKLTSREFRRESFSPCSLGANQVRCRSVFNLPYSHVAKINSEQTPT